MHRLFNLMSALLVNGKSKDETWEGVRYADMIICLQWFCEIRPEDNERIFLLNMHRLSAFGRKWTNYYISKNHLFQELDTIDIDMTAKAFPSVHTIRAGQGLKTDAVE